MRRGIALLLESDFFSTAEGQRHFAEQLRSIANCVQETMNMDVMFKLISAKNYDLEFTRDSLVAPQLNLGQVYKHTVDMFACVQKIDEGLDYAVEQSKALMMRYNVEADTMIIPPELALYMSLVPEQRKTYYIGGPTAPAEFNAGAKGFETASFRNMGIVTNRPLDSMGTMGMDSQALRRQTAIGEFYIVDPRKIKGYVPTAAENTVATNAGPAAVAALAEQVDDSKKVYFYDEESDTLEGVTVGDLKKAALFDEWVKDSTGGGTGSKITDTEVKKKSDYVLYVARPFITHDMYSAIMMKGGGAAGHTLFGESNFQFAGNVDVKNIHGHYTAHFNSVVQDPKQVKTLRDIMCAGYISGANTKFFGNMAETDVTARAKSIAKGLYDMRTTAPEDRQASKDKSMLVFAALKGNDLQVVSISSVAFPWDSSRSGVSEESGNNFPGGKENFEWYNKIIKHNNYSLSNLIIGGRDPTIATADPLIRADGSLNTMCFRGPMRYDDADGRGMILIPGKGHFGPDARPGDAAVRNGQLRSFKEARALMDGSDTLSSTLAKRGGL